MATTGTGSNGSNKRSRIKAHREKKYGNNASRQAYERSQADFFSGKTPF